MQPLPQTLADLRAAILSTWKGHDNADVCDAILARAAEFAHGEPLGFRALAKLAGRDFDDAVMGAVTILSSSRYSVFDSRLFVAHGEEFVQLPLDAYAHAMRDGWVMHPTTGERIVEWEAAVYPGLVPNDYLKSLVPAPAAGAAP